MERVVVLGASPNPSRYSHQAVTLLSRAGYEVYPVGIKEGQIEGKNIIIGEPEIKWVDTITLYIGPKIQDKMMPYILGLKPKRIIFNPGTENPILEEAAIRKGISVEQACTLVLLRTGQFAVT